MRHVLCPLLIFLAHSPLGAARAEDKDKPIIRFIGVKEGGGGELCQKLLRELSEKCEVFYLPTDRGGLRLSFRGGDGCLYYVSPNRIKADTAAEILRIFNLPFKEKVDGVEEEIGS